MFYMSNFIQTKLLHNINIKFGKNISILKKHATLQNGKKRVYTTYTLVK